MHFSMQWLGVGPKIERLLVRTRTIVHHWETQTVIGLTFLHNAYVVWDVKEIPSSGKLYE